MSEPDQDPQTDQTGIPGEGYDPYFWAYRMDWSATIWLGGWALSLLALLATAAEVLAAFE